MESMKDFEKELEHSFRTINEGDIISGTVISVNEEEIILDLNYYTQGVIKTENFTEDPSFIACEQVQIGDVVEATVIKMDDGNGSIELSKKEANDVLSWDKLKELMDNETVVTVKIRESVNAGVVTYLEGIRGFIPASQIASDYVENTDEWVGKELEAKVITVDKDKKKLVLSGKAVARKKEEEAHNHKVAMLVPGTVLEGTVESLQTYGAFVNIGNGLSGLVHISQISQKRISSPKEVLKEGQKVRVKILNTDNNKISLSMKALEEIIADEEPEDHSEEIDKYVSHESAGTSLGDLFAKLNIK